MVKRKFKFLALKPGEEIELDEEVLVYETWCLEGNLFLFIGDQQQPTPEQD